MRKQAPEHQQSPIHKGSPAFAFDLVDQPSENRGEQHRKEDGMAKAPMPFRGRYGVDEIAGQHVEIGNRTRNGTIQHGLIANFLAENGLADGGT